MHKILVLVMVVAAWASTSEARTWTVEKGGLGEFSTIHDAMGACSAGDTIMIGPGRYDDFHPFTAPAWTTEVIVGITKDNLTFIGAGNSTTIIGPTEMYFPGTVPEPMAIASVENLHAKFVDIGVENARNGIYWSHGRVEIEGCRFEGCQDGVYLFNEGGGRIQDSYFYSEYSIPIGVTTFSPCGPVSIIGCTFGGADLNEVGVGINGTQNVSIQGCHFFARNAIIFSGSSGAIVGCTTTEAVAQSLWVTDSSQVELNDNRFHGSYTSIYVNGWSVVNGNGNVFSGGADLATIYIHSQSQVTLNDNDILKSGDFAAKIGQYFFEIVTNDLTNNYWGTSDPDSIASWIWDYNDDPVTRAYIEFIPVEGETTPVVPKAWGSVKSMFR